MWLPWICYALLLGLPFEYFFFSRESSLSTSLKFQLGLFLAAWAGRRVTEVRTHSQWVLREILRPFPPRLLYAVLLLVCTQAISAAAAPEFRGNAAKAAIKTALGAVVMLATADVLRMDNTRPGSAGRAFRRFLAGVSLAGFLATLIGLLGEAGIPIFRRTVELFQPRVFMMGGHVRFSSTMEYPNTAASFLATALLASLSLALSRPAAEGRDLRLWWLGPAAIQSAGLVLTYSRGAVASVFAGILAATILVFRRLRPRERGLTLATLGAIALCGAVSILISQNWRRISKDPRGMRAAVYGLKAAEDIKHLVPDRAYREILGVRNNSSSAWQPGAYGIGGRWYEIREGKLSNLDLAGVIRQEVRPGEECALNVDYRPPAAEGDYLLIWHVVRRGEMLEPVRNSYSPGIVCSVRSANETRPQALSAKTLSYLKLIREERRRLAADFDPDRAELWRAALRMLERKPALGFGPDNFRLLKWRFMNIPEGDETYLAHNLYLEYLSGSGILGFAALVWFLFEFARVIAAVPAAASEGGTGARYFGAAFYCMFLVHGWVDYFLKFTPTFLVFWMAAGALAGRLSGSEDDGAPRV